mgnify:CR=1 FL=1
MKLRYFAWVRERIGKPEEDIDLPASVATIADAITFLAQRGEEYAHAFENPRVIRAAIDRTHVRADRASLGQAVLNLLSSAIDQTPPGDAVVLSAHVEDDGGVRIQVREQGVARGDPGDGFVIFRDGVSGDGKALAPIRSSVGLALTRSLLEVNSASLSVEAVRQDGTIFSLRLPPESVIAS